MVRFIDQRPTDPKLTLTDLLQRATATDTRAHGIKVADPSEGTIYYDTSGQSWTWDGDTLAEYDSRISEAKATADEAAADLEQASTDLVAARDRIAAVEAATTPEQMGTTAADQINTRRLIVGRDAILTGTVDVAQLNVTEAMSAEIVKAMTTESKRLIVTEDAILQRATVITSLVTPQLIAERINVKNLGADLITSGALQTDTATNRGVKITNTGLKAYDSYGNLTLDINGRKNLMVGDFTTGDSTQSRVVIRKDENIWGTGAVIDLYPSQGSSHGMIYQHSEGNLIISNHQTSGFTGGTGLAVTKQGVGVSGGLALNSGVLNSTGLWMGEATIREPGVQSNGFADTHISWPKMVNTPLLFFQVRNTSLAECAVVAMNASPTGVDIRVKNFTSRPTGYTVLSYIAICPST